MKSTLVSRLATSVAFVALMASPAVLAASKKTPTPPSAELSTASTASKSSKSDKTEKVNLNTADEKTIAGAKGVGDKLAKELVKNRPYRTWEEVGKVKGVGSGKKLDSLKKVLKLTDGSAAPAAAAEEKPAKEKKTSTKTEKAPEAAPAAAAGGVAAGGAAAAGAKSTKSASSEKSEVPKLAPGTKININTASAAELDKLPEIGPVKAQAIVDYRNANGKFAAPEDVMKVTGIKEGTYAKIKDYIVVK
jgi:comEA protein